MAVARSLVTSEGRYTSCQRESATFGLVTTFMFIRPYSVLP